MRRDGAERRRGKTREQFAHHAAGRLLGCGGENHPAARPTRTRARAAQTPPVAMRAGRGLAPRAAASEEMMRHDEAAELRNKTGFVYLGEDLFPRRPRD